jgi:hypothetical protein
VDQELERDGDGGEYVVAEETVWRRGSLRLVSGHDPIMLRAPPLTVMVFSVYTTLYSEGLRKKWVGAYVDDDEGVHIYRETRRREYDLRDDKQS